MRTNKTMKKGQMIIELLLVMGLSALLLPAIFTGFVATRDGRVQQDQRVNGIAYMQEAKEALRVIRESGWANVTTNGTFHPVVSGSTWILQAGSETVSGYSRSITISDVYRDSSGTIVSPENGTIDPSSKQADVTVLWTQPKATSINSTIYLTRYLDNLAWTQTTLADFNTDIMTQASATSTGGGAVVISNNNRAKWCSPAFSSATIDLPDGPPVAVAARANAQSNAVPNDVFVAVAPYSTTSAKLAYVTVTANTAVPTPTLKGTFTLDPAKYSSPLLVPSGIGFDNNFKTNDVKYYTSSGGKLYALLATDIPDHEVIAVQINNGVGDTFQDATNKIYKYWTYFNTKINGVAFNTPSANAADTGGDGNGFQTTPTNAYVQDGSYAVDTNSGSNTGTNCTGADKDKHRFYNYNFNIAGGSTINGIEVRLDAKVDSASNAPFMCVQMSWDGGTTWTTNKVTSTLSTTNSTYTLGGSSDTWGRSWGVSDFSNANFRLRISNVSSSTSRDFSLDWVAVKVYSSAGVTTTNDQAPFGYGISSIALLGDTAYVDSGGYLYAFDLTNIDSKSSSSQLDQIGCRILLDGYDCQPGSGTDRKYSAGETGNSWSDTTSPAHNDCSDGGNIELNADHQLSTVQVGNNKYVYVAVGAGTNPELNIVDVTTPPTSTIASATCGRGSDTGWKKTGSLDFDPASGTEEAANSVYAKSDGTRAYISSNGGIIRNGIPDSHQFYIIDTTNKSAPAFLSTWPTTVAGQHYANTPSSGYYDGDSTNIQLYPRRALTVLNGTRAVLVGQDGISDSTEPKEYQVLNLEAESSPAYCGGVNFLPGFNDLTYVSEADYDTFVYMVANTNEKQLKIIEGGPDGTYFGNGSMESSILDAGYSTAFNQYAATVLTPTNTDIQYQFAGADPVNGSCASATYLYTGPDGTSSTYYTATTSALTLSSSGSYKNPARCFRYKAYLHSTDFNLTPMLYDMTINYSP